jgi:EmrB/QacA subfamily drug resistance transporter
MEDSGNQKTALIISSLASFMTPFMLSGLNVALPTLGKEFGLDAIALSWVATSYILSAAIFLIPFGKLADIYGRKRIFVYGMIIYSLFSLLITASHSALLLIAMRGLQGIGAAMVFGTGTAILLSVTPNTQRGKVLGINVAAVYIGLSIGPFFGGFLTQHLGWRSIFYLNVILSVAVIVITVWKLRGEWAESKEDKFDLVGATLFGVAILLLMYGSSKLPQPLGIYTIAAGTLSLVVFVRWEIRTKNPILNIKLFTLNSVFAFSNLAAFMNYSASSAVTFLLSLYLQYVKGLSPQNAGLVLVSQPIFMAVISPFAGRLSDKIEPRLLASLGMTFTVVGLLLFTTIQSNSSLFFVSINLMVLGLGFGLFSSPNQNAVMSSVGRDVYGVASATLGTMRLTGQMLSMGIVMLIFSLSIGRTQITPEYHLQFIESIRIAFIIFAAFCFAGIFASLARGKVR